MEEAEVKKYVGSGRGGLGPSFLPFASLTVRLPWDSTTTRAHLAPSYLPSLTNSPLSLSLPALQVLTGAGLSFQATTATNPPLRYATVRQVATALCLLLPATLFCISGSPPRLAVSGTYLSLPQKRQLQGTRRQTHARTHAPPQLVLLRLVRSC